MSSESEYEGEEDHSGTPNSGRYGLSQWQFNAYGQPPVVSYYQPQFVAYGQPQYGGFQVHYGNFGQPNQATAYVYPSIDHHPHYEDDESDASDENSGEHVDEDGNSSEYGEEDGSSEDYDDKEDEESEDEESEDEESEDEESIERARGDFSDLDLSDLQEAQEENMAELVEAGGPSRKRHSYTIEFKIGAIEYAKAHGNRASAKKFNVETVMIRDWIRQEGRLRALFQTSGGKKCKQLPGSGRKLKDEKFDNELKQWVLERRANGKKVSRRIIQERAQKLLKKDDENVEFKASNGWLEKFLARHNFRLRVPTTRCKKSPIEFEGLIVDFLLFASKKRRQTNYAYIYSADETPVWLDPTTGKTIDIKGAKDVAVLTTGHEKMRVSVMLTARSDGVKCPPFVLLPRKRVIPEIVKKFSGRLNLIWAGTTWMDNELTKEYLKLTFGPSLFGRRLLAWDSYRCHISDETKSVCRRFNIDMVVVPGGCTKYIQCPDTHWNAPFKASIQRQYDDWMLTGDREWTAANNPKPPPMATYLDWIVNAWDDVPHDLIVISFKECGLTTATDGSEDHLVECFKKSGPFPNGLNRLRLARAMNQITDLVQEIDLSEDEINGYVSDNSIEL